jgi:hypothetical protein
MTVAPNIPDKLQIRLTSSVDSILASLEPRSESAHRCVHPTGAQTQRCSPPRLGTRLAGLPGGIQAARSLTAGYQR